MNVFKGLLYLIENDTPASLVLIEAPRYGAATAAHEFADHVGARARLEAGVIIQFLVPEDLDAARVDQVQVADLVGGRSGVARDLALAAGETRKPAQLETIAIVVVQPLDGQRSLQHGVFWKGAASLPRRQSQYSVQRLTRHSGKGCGPPTHRRRQYTGPARRCKAA